LFCSSTTSLSKRNRTIDNNATSILMKKQALDGVFGRISMSAANAMSNSNSNKVDILGETANSFLIDENNRGGNTEIERFALSSLLGQPSAQLQFGKQLHQHNYNTESYRKNCTLYNLTKVYRKAKADPSFGRAGVCYSLCQR